MVILAQGSGQAHVPSQPGPGWSSCTKSPDGVCHPRRAVTRTLKSWNPAHPSPGASQPLHPAHLWGAPFIHAPLSPSDSPSLMEKLPGCKIPLAPASAACSHTHFEIRTSICLMTVSILGLQITAETPHPVISLPCFSLVMITHN